MYVAMWAIGVLVYFMLTALIYKKIESGRLVIVGGILYFSGYIIMSGLLFWIDKFSIMTALVLTLLVGIVGSALLFMKNKKKFPVIIPALKKYIPVLVLMVVFACLASNRAGLYPIGQDQGLYQEKAMFLMNGYNDNTMDFKEYDYLTSPTEKQEYMDRLGEMDGVYLLYGEPVNDTNDTRFQIHGVSTFAAILALWGKMFGLTGMTTILTVTYLLGIGGVWLICDNLRLKRSMSFTAAAMIGINPMVLWGAQNILTEIIITMLIVGMFVILTDNLKKQVYNYSVIPAIAYCYLHVTSTLMVPLFVLIYLYLYFWMRKKSVLTAIILVLAGYVSGLKMMYTSAPIYTSMNLDALFSKIKYALDDNNFFGFVFIVSILFIALLFVLEYMGVSKKFRKSLKKLSDTAKGRRIAKIVFTVMVIAIIIATVLIGIKSVKSGNSPLKLTMLCFMFTTGYICLPLAFLGTILNSAKYGKEHSRCVIAVSLLYVLVVYALVVRFDIYYYYYMARYFIPYMMLVVIMAMTIFDCFKPVVVIPICTVVMTIVVMQNPLLLKERDLTYGDFEIVNSIASCVGENDAVILCDNGNMVHKMFMMPVKAMTGADIYFTPDAENSNAKALAMKYENVFILDYDYGSISEDTGKWMNVYRGTLHTSVYDVFNLRKDDDTDVTAVAENQEEAESEEDNVKRRDPFPYPIKLSTFDSNVGLYIYKGQL